MASPMDVSLEFVRDSRSWVMINITIVVAIIVTVAVLLQSSGMVGVQGNGASSSR